MTYEDIKEHCKRECQRLCRWNDEESINGKRHMEHKMVLELIEESERIIGYCEWKLSETNIFTFDSECGAELEVTNTNDVTCFEYCPYCGKKIKVI